MHQPRIERDIKFYLVVLKKKTLKDTAEYTSRFQIAMADTMFEIVSIKTFPFQIWFYSALWTWKRV